MSEQPNFIRVEKVENGYIVTSDTPGSYGRVATSSQAVVEIVADLLGVSCFAGRNADALLLADQVCQAMAEAKASVADLMAQWEAVAYGTKEAA